MLTPPNCCIQVTISINLATRCFETVIADIHSAGSGFRCVLLADSKHQRQKRTRIIAILRQRALKKMGSGLHLGAPDFSRFILWSAANAALGEMRTSDYEQHRAH
jgi:hypothetical protein